ncbi:hypothetical protein IGI37_000610 [Enterococcus sp. AZ194]|uniref:SpaA isopeptide-forming pilin-related protein n=1 Tax=Enterococcus sp. AZ194 TaxID=2774629 RepID=UPI003F22703D
MKTYGFSVLMLVSLVFLLVGNPVMAYGAENDSYAISIQKYKLDESTALPEDFPHDGSKATKVLDAKGNALAPLAGIHYEIVRVTPVSEGSGFQVVEGVEAFATTIVTDQSGLARIDGLVQGMYRVTEKNANTLKNVMEPVILELPLPQPDGKAALSEVYLYPKSSIVSKTNEPTPSKSKERLPQTSGNIGNYHPFVYVSLVILLMGGLGFLSMKQKKSTQ